MMSLWPLRAWGTAVLIAIVVAAGSVGAADVQAPSGPPPTPGPPPERDSRTLIDEISKLFYSGQYPEAVRRADEFVARHGPTLEALPVLLFQAESRARLGQRDQAIRSYEAAISPLSQLNNVQQREFAWVYFRLSLLYREQQQLATAVARVESGLRLAPQATYFQILLGELFAERGERARALMHFKTVAISSLPVNEERAVLGMKIDRLATGTVGSSVQPPDMRTSALYRGVSIGLLPLNDPPKGIVLSDVCVVLASTPKEQIFTTPPFLCIEILSAEDRMSRMLEKIDDYLQMGVPHVWVIDPGARRGYHYTPDGMREAKDGVLRTSNPELAVPLAEVWE